MTFLMLLYQLQTFNDIERKWGQVSFLRSFYYPVDIGRPVRLMEDKQG